MFDSSTSMPIIYTHHNFPTEPKSVIRVARVHMLINEGKIISGVFNNSTGDQALCFHIIDKISAKSTRNFVHKTFSVTSARFFCKLAGNAMRGAFVGNFLRSKLTVKRGLGNENESDFVFQASRT